MHGLPPSEFAWLVAPTSAINREVGNNERTCSASAYGVAPSNVALISRTPWEAFCLASAVPSTVTGVPGLAGQYRQDVLYQTLLHVMNGALAAVENASGRQVFSYELGHAVSVQFTAL